MGQTKLYAFSLGQTKLNAFGLENIKLNALRLKSDFKGPKSLPTIGPTLVLRGWERWRGENIDIKSGTLCFAFESVQVKFARCAS